MKKFITEIVLVPDYEKDPQIFSEGAIKIRVEDEAGGRFLTLSNVGDSEPVRIDFSELDEICAFCKELQQ